MTNTCKANETAEFKTFWDQIWQPHSRNTDGRGLARESFRKQLLKGVDAQDIVDGAAWFVRNLTERNKDYVPLSSTWLNREGWDGLCDKERAFRELQSSQAQSPTNIVSMPTRIVYPPHHFMNQKKQEA